MDPKTFIASEESINSYGYRVLTDGIDVSAFKKNPVMLFNHDSGGWCGSPDYKGPIGRWENIRKENGQLKADAVFDMEDETGEKIGKKVENNFIRAASIGFEVIETSNDPSVMLRGQTRPTITKCRLIEISVVDIPSNQNALALYDQSGKRIELKDESVFEACQLSLIQHHNPNKPDMKLKLSNAYKGLLKFFNKEVEEGQSVEVEVSAEELNGLNAKVLKLGEVETELSTLKSEKATSDATIQTLSQEIDLAVTTEKVTVQGDATASDKLKAIVAELKAANQKLAAKVTPGAIVTGKDEGGENEQFLSETDALVKRLKAEKAATAAKK